MGRTLSLPALLRRLAATRAFSLIELLVVILILGVLIAVAAPAYLGQKEKAQDAVAKQYLAVAYKAAKAATVRVDEQGKYVSLPTYDHQDLADAIQASEPGLDVAVGNVGQDEDPQRLFVDGAGSDQTTATRIVIHNQSESGKYCTYDFNSTSTLNTYCNETGIPAPALDGAGPSINDSVGASNDPVVAQEGVPLTATPGDWTEEAVSYEYQWQSSFSPFADIGGDDATEAELATFTPDADQIGAKLRVCVTAVGEDDQRATVCSSEVPVSGTVLPSPPVMSGTGPAITGSMQEDETLTASSGTWTSSTPVTYSYQWLSCEATTSTCSPVGADQNTYVLQGSDVGRRILVVVSADNGSGSLGSAYSSPTDPSEGTQPPVVASSLPVGVVVSFAGQTVPSGWLLADGTAVSRSTYSELFAETGTAYGAGNGSTTFNLPNLQGRLPLGKATSGAAATLGASGGALDSSGSVSLGSVTSNFSWTDSPANPSFVAKTYTWNAESAVAASDYPWVGTHTTIGPVTFTTTESGTVTPRAVSASGTANLTGSYSAANPPFRAVRYIVKAATTAQLPACAVVSSAATATPAGATSANGSAATGALAACLDSAFGGNAPNLEGRFALGKATTGTGSALNSSGGQLAQTASVTRNQASTQMTVTPTPYSVNLTISSPAPTSLNYSGIATQYGGNNWNGVCSPDPPSCSQSNSRGPIGPFGSAHSPSVGSDHGAVVASNTYAPSLTTSQAPAATSTSSSYSAPYAAVNFHAGLTSSKTGDLMPFAGTSLPQGYLRANGDCYSTSTYANLFNAIGYTYGGSGASFCVPDLSGRSPLGKAASGPAATLGATGGALGATPSATFAGFTPSLTVPAHTFSWTTPNHTYNITGAMNGSLRSYCGTGGEGCWQANLNQTIVRYTGYGTTYPSVSGGSQVVSSAGSTPTVNAASAVSPQTANLPAQSPPYQVVNYLIKH